MAAPVKALEAALSTELLGSFFSLGGAPAGQALLPQLILTPDPGSQVTASRRHVVS